MEIWPRTTPSGAASGTRQAGDWAAKGTLLLGVRAVLAESFERFHRSSLIGMGVLPLQYGPESATSLGLTGHETFGVRGIEEINSEHIPNEVVVSADGHSVSFQFALEVPHGI